MKPYDPASACPKCGRDPTDPSDPMPFDCYAKTEWVCASPDHLLRTCVRCGYQWREACLDAAPLTAVEPESGYGYQQVGPLEDPDA